MVQTYLGTTAQIPPHHDNVSEAGGQLRILLRAALLYDLLHARHVAPRAQAIGAANRNDVRLLPSCGKLRCQLLS